MAEPAPLTPAQLRCLAAWLPILEAPGFSAGHWRGGDADEEGVIHMPWFEYDERIAGWPGGCGGGSLIVMGFDWMTWLGTPEGRALSSDPAAIERASSADLARLVTAIVRGDRFSEGNLAGAIERGFVAAICRRAAVLLGEAEQSSWAGASKVATTEFWRIRIGDLRVIYPIADDERLVVALRVARRSESTYRQFR